MLGCRGGGGGGGGRVLFFPQFFSKTSASAEREYKGGDHY